MPKASVKGQGVSVTGHAGKTAADLYEVQLYAYEWTIGTHNNVAIVAQLGNHSTQNLSFDATIVETPTSATTPSDYLNQNWGPTVPIMLTFTDLNMSIDVAGATISLNLSMGYWSVVDNGDGTYDLTIS